MIQVEVLSARRVPDSDVVAIADVVLDQCLQLVGVEIHDDGGQRVAVAPRRPFGDRGPVLQWSRHVAADLAAAVLARLDGKLATVGPDPIDQAAHAEALAALTADSIRGAMAPPGAASEVNPAPPTTTTNAKETT